MVAPECGVFKDDYLFDDFYLFESPMLVYKRLLLCGLLVGRKLCGFELVFSANLRSFLFDFHTFFL